MLADDVLAWIRRQDAVTLERRVESLPSSVLPDASLMHFRSCYGYTSRWIR